jgi:hypothetical protein
MDDMYKLGYTANKQTPELVKQHLLNRYGTYFPDVECVDLFEVKQPIQAEKQLFEWLKEYKYNNEIYKADYEMTIKPQLENIKQLYCCENVERVISEKDQKKTKTKLIKKVKYFINNLQKIQNYIMSHLLNVNQRNNQIFGNILTCISIYNRKCYPPPPEKKTFNLCKKYFIENMNSHIEQFDYSDSGLFGFVEFIESIY